MTALALPAGSQQKPSLPPLREELTLHPGPRTADGAPSWTIQDPATGRFFRIGWMEFEILRRWHLADVEAIATAVSRDTPIQAEPGDVEALARFLSGASLLQRRGEAGVGELMRQVQAARQDWGKWLLKNYLFFRVPLLRPDGLLTRLLPYVSFLYSRGFAIVTLLAAALGVYLVTRQWDTFRSTFLHFFSIEGAIAAGLALAGAKMLHEFGHALTAKRFGCRVQTMGVAFMVLYPMLYTDVSEAWKLPKRGPRLAIGAAGVGAELALAAYATLAWSFLPDGPLRSAVFLLATTTWVLTVLINSSPFMRFDGYFLLSDFLDMPNLHERSFALARWWMREVLFGLGEAPPEHVSKGRRRALIAFAFGTWLYRFILFLGIALLVYYLFFKALGILLFAVEIWWFIARPVWREVLEWVKRRDAMRWNTRTRLTAGFAAGLVLLALVPWRSTINAPAVLRAAQQSELFLDSAGRMEQVLVKANDKVSAGQPLFILSNPDIDHEIAQAERKVATLRVEAILQAGADQTQRERARLARSELDSAVAELEGLRSEKARLTVTAPFDGVVAEVAEPLLPGEWLPAGERLGMLIQPDRALVEAFVLEADLGRIGPGTEGQFIPDNAAWDTMDALVTALDDASTRVLAHAVLASTQGGDIAVREDAERQLVPVDSVYRVLLSPTEGAAPARIVRGRVALSGARESMAARVWRRTVAVLVRESGF